MVASGSGAAGIFVPLPAAIFAAITAIVSFIAYVWLPEKFYIAFGAFLLLTVTTGILVAQTGNVSSPFIALWLVVGVFSGIFGTLGISVLFVIVNLYLIDLLIGQHLGVDRQQLIVYLLAGELPLAISYVIWHSKSSNETEKAKAFDALAKQLSQVANKSEIVINAIADGVVAIDERQTIQLINPAAQQVLGWRKEDALGLDYKSVVKLSTQKQQELSIDQDPLQQVQRLHKSIVNNELILTTNSGKKIQVSLVVSPVSTTQPSAGAIAVFRDITGEKEEERQKGEFISTASHEMRTPVAAIEGYLGLALNPATANIDDKARTYLQKAHESAQHLGHLFQDLLDVSKAEDGRLKTNPTSVDVVKMLNDLVINFTPKAQEKQLALYCKPCETGVGVEAEGTGPTPRTISPAYYVYADADHLREIFDNLLENAVKYTKQGSVTVDVTGDEKEVVISFADTGIGIPPEDVPHLFQKFYRVDNSDTREIGGTGLGLYLCRRLVENSNGRVWVKSKLGEGSTFFVALPRLSHDRAAEITKQLQLQTPAITHPPKPAVVPPIATASPAQPTTTPVRPVAVTVPPRPMPPPNPPA